MATCSCGTQLKEFWIWRDGERTPHASAFRPEIQAEASVLAASPRDAVTPLNAEPQPKHDVHSADDSRVWAGRCQAGVAKG